MSLRHIVSRLMLLLLCGNIAIPAALAAAGRTPGTFTVSPTGAATYTIPIFAPPGPKGIKPNITLTYNSQSGIGPVGVGWSIGGQSSIYRCNRTYAQDSSPAPVTLTAADAFCKDGNRLQLTSGTYGSDSSTYQTELADFTTVTAHGAAGNGPSYFTVQGNSGLTYSYGHSTTSQVLANESQTASAWYLDSVTDSYGNVVESYDYQVQTGTLVPYHVYWSPIAAGSTTNNYEMLFNYGQNNAATSVQGYTAGTQVQNASVLNAVTVYQSTSVIRQYKLTYTVSATTGRNTLTSVQECADGPVSNCLLPTIITYPSGSTPGLSGSSSSAISSGAVKVTPIDLNGDGRADLAYAVASGSSYHWYVVFSSGTGFGAPVDTGITVTNTDPVLFDDFLAQGYGSILAPKAGAWTLYTYNGSTFSPSAPILSLDSNRLVSTKFSYAVADINGDGLPDIVWPASDSTLHARLNTGNGTTLSFGADTGTGYSVPITIIGLFGNNSIGASAVKHMDFNGDGRQDLLIEWTTGAPIPYEWGVVLGNGSTLTTGANVAAATALPVNWNDDGCTDLAAINPSVGVYVSPCDSLFGTGILVSSTYSTAGVAIDWDGDGRTDLLVNQGGSNWQYFQSNGSPYASSGTPTSIPIANGSPIIFDQNGDGLHDAAFVSTAGAVSFELHNNSGLPPDLATSFADGQGNSASPTYISVPDAWNSYFFPRTDAPTGYENYIGPLCIVNSVFYSDPSSLNPGAKYQEVHFYAGAWMNLQGRGFSGFEAHQHLDLRTGIYQTLDYDLAFPYTGMLTGVFDTQNNQPSQTLFYRTYTPAEIVLDSVPGSQRIFPYVSSSTSHSYELGTVANPTTREIASTVYGYSYDNFGNPLTITQTVTDEDAFTNHSWTTSTTNTYVPGPPGCTSLLSTTQVDYSYSINSNHILRKKSFEGDTAHCNYTSIVTEPSSPTYMVTEAPQYDSFGNVSSDWVQGIHMAARTTTLNWGASGQFIVSTTDALSEPPTTASYYTSLGLLNVATDSNGESTTWSYDAFGRKTKELRPDGTYTTWQYEDCANSGGCLIGPHALTVLVTVYGNDNSVTSSGTEYLDPLDRPLVSSKILSTGAYARNEVRYDPLGRIAQRAFPCSWSSLSTNCPYWTVNSYDILGRLTGTTRPASASNSDVAASTVIAYSGDTIVTTDANQKSSTKVIAAIGTLAQIEDANFYAISLSYDAYGSLLSATDNLSHTLATSTYDYGLQPYRRTSTDVDAGNRTYTYDALGELTGWSDAKGQTGSAKYDALSRITDRYEPDEYSHWAWGTAAVNHEIGKLFSKCSIAGTAPTACSATTYDYYEQDTYHSFGPLFQRTISLAGASPSSYTYTYQYNNQGLLDTLTYPTSTSGYALELKYGYGYGALNSIMDISDSPNVTLWTADATNAAGQITHETLANTVVVTSTSIDAVTGLRSSIQSGVSGNGTALQNESYLYDEVGNLTERQNNHAALTENFFYDNLYRLDHSTLGNTTNLQMGYDATGNIASRSDVASGATWAYDATHVHRVLTAGDASHTYTYDANGNVLTRNGNANVWTSYNYPSAIQNSAFLFNYGPDRQLYRQNYNNSTEITYYIGKLLEQVNDGGVIDYRHYVYANGKPIAIYSRTSAGANNWRYALSDNEQSISALTSNTGTTLVSESFAPYGWWRSASTWSGSAGNIPQLETYTHKGYTFQNMLGTSTGLIHLNGRVEDAITGRFLSADPVVQDPTNTQDYNRYSYGRNNPLSFVDPTGFDAWCPGNDPGCNPQIYDDPQATIYFSNGLTYEGGQGWDNGVQAYNETGGVNWQGDTIAHTSVGFYWGAKNDSSYSNYLGRYNPDTGMFSSAFDGVPDFFAADLAAQYGNFGARFLQGAQGTAQNFGVASAIAGLILATGPSGAASDGTAASKGADLAFSQRTASPYFSEQGDFSGQSIADVAAQLRSGALDSSDVPVQVVTTIDGNTLIVNTRSSLALRQAGVPQSQWTVVDMTGDAATEAAINQRLLNNNLTSSGTSVIRITGSGSNASTLIPGP